MNTILLLHGVMSSAGNLRRNQRDLEDLGWTVLAVDLPGHGNRPAAGSADSIDGMALDVAAQLDGRSYVVVGHSLGAIVGLRLAQLQPDLVSGVVLEDPPGLASINPFDVATEVIAAAHHARNDPAGEVAALLQSGSAWTPEAAEDAVRSRAAIDTSAIEHLLTTQRWDLVALVEECPRPVQLIAAREPDSALRGADRDKILAMLPPSRVRIIDSAHSIHRDRAALWLITVDRFANTLGPRR
ncbi:alpha/beta fold hydrolase [Microlunatus speluncae]|uniref:alpha/beta fold hydrolase n=1 Tax=Microlunatus speluncae TaxID=2594267 RepID=UPI00126609E6|nr:alpha/beta fold hydrolase [Microlunatus speluncae]